MDRMISKKELQDLVLFSPAHIDRLENPDDPCFDPAFPKRVKMGQNRVGWWMPEVMRYLEFKAGRQLASSS